MSDSSHRQGNEDDSVHVSGIEFDEVTEVALRAEQDERDESIDDRIPRPWANEEDATLLVAAGLGVEMGEYVVNIQALFDAGLDPAILTEHVELNMLTGGVVIGALQLAGVLVPAVRPVIDGILDDLDEHRPTPTEEQYAAIEAATESVVRAQFPEPEIEFNAESN